MTAEIVIHLDSPGRAGLHTVFPQYAAVNPALFFYFAVDAALSTLFDTKGGILVKARYRT